MKNIINFFNQKILLNLILLFCITRIIFFKLGISPDINNLQQMWQLLSPELLEKDYFKSLLYLHSQPPLWNAIYGIFIKIFGTDLFLLNKLMHLFNIMCSILIVVYFFWLCKEFDLKKRNIYLLFFLFIGISPSLLMYENFIHYTNLTVLFFLQISFHLIRFGKYQKFKDEVKIYIYLLLLMYTGTAFGHPIVIIVVFISLYLIKKQKKLESFIIFIIVTFISIIPSIKNFYYFNYFANTTWTGIQLVQVIERYDWKYPLCWYGLNEIEKHEKLFIEENPKKDLTHPSLTGKLSRYNSIGLIYRSQQCLPFALDNIKNDPMRIVKIIKFKLISSHGHFAFDFLHMPNNWLKNFGFFENLKSNDLTNTLKVRSLQLYHLFFYIFFLLFIFNFLKSKKRAYKETRSIAIIFFLYTWIIFISHVGAGFEFERFRHTGHALHIIFFCILVRYKFNLRSIFNKY